MSNKLYIIKSKVTCQDAADVYSEDLGKLILVGDDEFRVMDDIENPSFSYDFGSLESAMLAYPNAQYVESSK